MMVIFLIGLVSMVSVLLYMIACVIGDLCLNTGCTRQILMRTLRKDYARYSKDDDMNDLERDLGDEYGWKQIHGDVFRPPAYPMLLSVFVGTGYQIATVTFFVIVFAIFGYVIPFCLTLCQSHSCFFPPHKSYSGQRAVHGAWVAAVDGDLRVRGHLAHQWVLWGQHVRSVRGSQVDQADAHVRLPAALTHLWHCFPHQLHRSVADSSAVTGLVFEILTQREH